MQEFSKYRIIPVENWCKKKEEAKLERANYGVARQDMWSFEIYFLECCPTL